MTSLPTSLNKVEADLPPDHLLFSVVSTIFFLPLGVAAILQGIKVRKAIKLNDFITADYASRLAAEFALSAVLLGTNIGVLVTVLVIVLTNN